MLTRLLFHRPPLFSICDKQVDTAADFLDDFVDDVDENVQEQDDVDQVQQQQQQDEAPEATTAAPSPKPVKPKRLTSKSTSAPGNSLEILDACLPEEPPHIVPAPATTATVVSATPAPGASGATPSSVESGGSSAEISPWLRQALFSSGGDNGDVDVGQSSPGAAAGATPSSAVLPLTARLAPLAQRMRSLLLRGVYARTRAGKNTYHDHPGLAETRGGSGWADGGRPAGFLGAGLAEELCLAVFGRIQALRADGVGKQVCACLCMRGWGVTEKLRFTITFLFCHILC